MTTNIYHDFDFRELESPDFKEDSVREVLILPLLTALGYERKQVVRSKALEHPFIKIGSKKRAITLVPDYLLKVEDSYAWVLDAKAPTENISAAYSEHYEQVYSYAMHPEVRTKFFALCNGKEFILFRTDEKQPLLFFPLAEIVHYWEELNTYLAPTAFQSGKSFTYTHTKKVVVNTGNFDYLNRPLLEEQAVKKQTAKRHFGVHGYFTKQVWNVVQAYITNFSQPGDIVLDPFGGSGVTAIEAMMTGRKSIHIDLNPMSVFIVESLCEPVNIEALKDAFANIKENFLKNIPETNEAIEKALQKYPYPKGISLPKNSDVISIEQLFSKKQLAQLALLKAEVYPNRWTANMGELNLQTVNFLASKREKGGFEAALAKPQNLLFSSLA